MMGYIDNDCCFYRYLFQKDVTLTFKAGSTTKISNNFFDTHKHDRSIFFVMLVSCIYSVYILYIDVCNCVAVEIAIF